MSQSLQEEEIDSIPITRSTKQRVQGVAAILPGVLRDSKGNLHFHGSSAEETNWTLDGFRVSDPISGRLEMALGAESVGSMEIFSQRYSPAFGKGTGGAIALETRTGEDHFQQRFTNFAPGVGLARGLRVRDWMPRYSFSGPVVKDRAWFSNSLDLLYEENFILELPPGQDRNLSLSVNNNFRLKAKLNARQTLSLGLVADYLQAPKSGLSPLDPVETTLHREARRYFFNIRDQIILSPESMLDVGYAAYRSNSRGVPRGSAAYRVTPQGRTGNYPIQSLLTSRRDEVRANLFFPPKESLGQHRLTAGASFSLVRYFQDVRRGLTEYFREDGTQSSELLYRGNARFSESNLESGAFLQDRWVIRPRLVAELGLRWDRDQVVSRGAVTPRLHLSYMPGELKGTKLSAGLAWIPASTYLGIFTRHLDQYSVFTAFAPDGETPLGPPEIRVFHLDRALLAIPSTRNLSASWHQSLPGETGLQVNWLRKRGIDGYAHVPIAVGAGLDSRLPPGSHVIRHQLRNFKYDTYDSVELSVSKPLLGAKRWFASYTYSRSWSNAALDIGAGGPVLYSDTEGRFSWDVPHRAVSWATFPIGKKTAVSYFAEWRDGFPFSVHDEHGKPVGQVNGWRLPRHFNINIHIERKITFLGHKWALRPGIDNLTNHPNYSLVNNNIASPQFLHLFGRSPRRLVVRARWLGVRED